MGITTTLLRRSPVVERAVAERDAVVQQVDDPHTYLGSY